MTLKECMVGCVAEVQGCKATELVVLVAEYIGRNSQVGETTYDLRNFNKELQELIATGQLIEVEYVLPNMTYRSKSFLLPSQTVVTLKK